MDKRKCRYCQRLFEESYKVCLCQYCLRLFRQEKNAVDYEGKIPQEFFNVNFLRYFKTCVWCNEEYMADTVNQLYCSTECREAKNHVFKHKQENGPKHWGVHKMRFEVFKRDGFRCVYCGKGREDNVKLELDHVIPASKGGPYSFENLVTCCFECNRGKASTSLLEKKSIEIKRKMKKID